MINAVWVGGLVSAIVWLLLPMGRRINPGSRAVQTEILLPSKLLGRQRNQGTGNPSELIFTEVAGLLRAGVPAGAAWRRAAGVEVDAFGVPDQIGLSHQVGPEPAAAMVAAAQIAVRLGAPLALVLQTVDSALRTEAQAQSDREAALAGPQTTARVLLALPLLGLVLGWVLGAHPLGVMVSGGIGTVSFALGAALLAAGRWWITRLVAAAAGQNGDSP